MGLDINHRADLKKGSVPFPITVVNVSQVLTLDKSFLTEPLGKLSRKKMLTLNDGLKLALSI